MAVDTLVLAANPGSASRKYALYKNGKLLINLHFEFENGQIICTAASSDKTDKFIPNIATLEEVPAQLILPVLARVGIKLKNGFDRIGLRMVAPTRRFLSDCLLDENVLKDLKSLERYVPLHIKATLEEAEQLLKSYKDTPIVVVSDSTFHITKPDYAWNYAINLDDADKLDIKRFGYHGISLTAIVRQLREAGKLPQKLDCLPFG